MVTMIALIMALMVRVQLMMLMSTSCINLMSLMLELRVLQLTLKMLLATLTSMMASPLPLLMTARMVKLPQGNLFCPPGDSSVGSWGFSRRPFRNLLWQYWLPPPNAGAPGPHQKLPKALPKAIAQA